MGWWRRWGPWPGRGPFSYLPPWQRPGWWGRGWWCWWWWTPPPSSAFPSRDEELSYLRSLESELRERLKQIEERLRELEEGKS
ncbi:MAG: hypothetical protein BA066_04280 [Candidatus Korarchaeota archaeon NZ13-K]|nr:MAG: hypothetical protein BA066_04280 [Candidatus Korarchaeota archaeon NZ13-K]